MYIKVIIEQMIVLFAMILCGYLLWRKKWIDDGMHLQLSKLVVQVFNPLLIINGVINKTSTLGKDALVQNVSLSFFFFIFLIIAGYLIIWLIKPMKNERNMFILLGTIPNAGFMGIPVITSIYGDESMIYIVFYILICNVILYTYGMYLVDHMQEDIKKQKVIKNWRKQLKDFFNFGVIASIGAIVIFLLQLKIPQPVANFCSYMGSATIPLSMILIGISIAKSDLKELLMDKTVYKFLLLRMVIIPIGVILLLKQFPIYPIVFGVFALQLAMPTGSIGALIMKEKGLDELRCSGIVVVSTLFSLITIPLISAFL